MLADADGGDPLAVADLQRLLYGLYAILRLHNAQEEEAAFSLLPAPESSLTTAPSTENAVRAVRSPADHQ